MKMLMRYGIIHCFNNFKEHHNSVRFSVYFVKILRFIKFLKIILLRGMLY